MSERFWRNLSTALGWVSIAMLFGLVTFTSSLEIKDLDLWLHLRMGWWICHHGFVPGYDVLSGSIAGKPWVNHEWLFQVLVYKVWAASGFNGLISMQSMVVALTFLVLLFLGYSRDRQWLLVYTLLMVLTVYETRFTIRPDIFSLLFFVLYIYILSLHINKRWALYALIILQVLWSNMHGFFFFGPLLVFIGLFSEFIKRHLPLPYEWNGTGRLTDGEYGALKKMLPLLMLACCANPEGFRGAWYPIHVFFGLAGNNKIFFEHITELQRPILPNDIFTDKFLEYKLLIFFSAISFVFNRRKIDISSLLMWIVFLGFSLVAIRNLIFFAVAAYMVIMVNVISISWEDLVPLNFTSNIFKYIVEICIKLLIMFFLILQPMINMSGNGYFDFDNYNRKSEFFGVSKRVYPYKAVDFLVRNKIKGNFFNDFNSGAYLIGRAYPNVRVFIDGRTELYGADFFENYQKVWRDGKPQVFAYFERKGNITGAFLDNTHQDIPRDALKMFHSFKNWSIVYLDYDAVIFLKRTPANMPIIDKFGVDIKKWKPKPMDLFKLGTTRIDPFPYTSRAYILETLGADDAAISEAKEALRVEPGYPPAYNMLGRIYSKHRDFRKAFECYRLGVMYSRDKLARLGLAQAYENLKYYKYAIIQYQLFLGLYPKDAQAYFGLARVYAEIGEDKQALGMLNSIPKGVQDRVAVQRIRDIINSHKLKRGLLPNVRR